ncbi:MAG TPA: fused MFS/spermidine synthase [Polyangiaceae bacterium]|nr:fused MFS/spermidine synthase [Polyangiaceae bacterium]
MARSFRVVALLLFGSGFSALVYQTTWQRMFRLTFGASTAASAAVLAIFLGGLGLGGAVLGRRVERSRQPLVFYGNLELGIAGLAALSPLLCAAVNAFYLHLGGSQALGTFGSTAIRLLLTALVIGPAAALMGGTLPAVARAVVEEADDNRSSLSLLYSINTVGSVFGALVGPLLLFGLLGNELTLYGAACVNALVGLSARALGRRLPELPPGGESASDVDAGVQGDARAVGARFIYAVAALVGFAFLALELVWYRILTPLLGGSSLTFGLILACALSGIGLGGYWFSRRSAEKGMSLSLVSWTLALEALCVLVPFAWGDDLAFVAAYLRQMGSLGFGHLIAGWVFFSALVVLPTAIVSGYQFPMLFALLGRGRRGVGGQVGRAYAFNTVGTLTGSLLAGFILIPELGAVSTWRLLARLLVLSAAVCAVAAWRHGSRIRALVGPLFVAGCALALSRSAGPGVVFRHSPIGAGRFDLSGSSENARLSLRRRAEIDVVWQRDGVESTVAINAANGISFLVNGKSDGAVVGDKGTQAFLGLLPAALHGHAKSAFVVGLGTGMSAGLLGRVPGIEHVEVAELERSVLEVARRAALANGDVLENPKVQILNGDGRELMLTSSRRYDLILSEPSNPYRAGVASLFTREFYQAAAVRLQRGGLFAQWLQAYEVDARTLSIAIATLRAVFPEVSLWGGGSGDLILIGSFSPLVIDTDRLRHDLQDPAYANWLRRAWLTEGVEGLVAHHLAPSRLLDRMASTLPAPVNTDDVNVLEFAFARSVGDHRYRALADILETIKADYRPQVTGALDWALVENQRHRAGFQGYRVQAPSAKTQATVAGCFENMRRASALWPVGEAADDLVERWVLGSIQAMNGDDAALGQADRLQAAGFLAESQLVRARLAEQHKDYDAAIGALSSAFEALRKSALPLCDAGERALKRAAELAAKRPERALDLLRLVDQAPFAIMLEEADRHRTQFTIASSLAEQQRCADRLGSYRSKPPWEYEVLAYRAQCLNRIAAADAGQASADLRQYALNEPQTFASAELATAHPDSSE